MKRKSGIRLLATLLVILMLGTALTGCGGTTPPASTAPSAGASSEAPSAAASSEGGEASTEPEAENPFAEHITIDMYNNAANYQGEQTGWYAKVLQDELNITLNIIAPQVGGDALYKTRAAAGSLGDICVIDNDQLEECIQAGLVADMTDLIKNYPNLMEYMDHFEYFNGTFEAVNPEKKIYGLATFQADTSPTTYSEELAYSSPILNWTYYSAAGRPEMNNLQDLLTTLKKMRDTTPTTKDGKKIIPITLWKDWDTWSMENVRWLCNWYGFEQPEGTGSVLLNAKGDVVPFTADDGMYKKILKFYHDANQMGLVDPDSAAQDWNKVAEKLTNNQVLLMWYSWQRGFYNTIARGQEKDGGVFVPIKDLNIIQTSDAYYGNGRVFSLGSKAVDPERCMALMDFLVSPKGLRYHANGIEGFNYVKNAEGKWELTEVGQVAFQDNTPVPEEWGGGGYQDGQSKINSMIISDFTIDPETGEFYNSNYWSSTMEKNKTALNIEWSETYGGAVNAMDYLLKNNMVTVVPSINTSFGADSSDIKNKRSQCSELLKNTSWKMVFAKDEAEFNALWTKMQSDLEGLGWNDIVAADSEKCQKIVALRAKAVE